MTQATVESIFGAKAGMVWQALNRYGPSNITNLMKTTSMSREEVFGALGWLGREDKIEIEQKGRAMIFSLRESELRLEVPPVMISQDNAPKANSKRRKNRPLKKDKVAQAVKPSARQDKRQAEDSDRTKDFLLH